VVFDFWVLVGQVPDVLSADLDTHAAWSKLKEDGYVLCAIIGSLSPDSIDLSAVNKSKSTENLKLALKTAETVLGIPSLVTVDDFTNDSNKNVDALIENYLCMLISASKVKSTKVQVRRYV
jgi:hypothetical protein